MKTTPDISSVGVHWAVTSTGLTGYSTLVLNSTDHTLEADMETATDAGGYVVTTVTYNHRESVTLETWVSGSAGASNASIITATVPAPGDKFTITDSVNTIISGSAWIAGSSTIKRANNTFAKVSTTATRYAKITS